MASPLARIITNEIYRVRTRTKRKPELKPSEIPTLKGYTARLVDQNGCAWQQGEIMLKGILFCLAIYGAYKLGWAAAHSMVAEECRRNGGFFVGKTTFKCTEVKKDD